MKSASKQITNRLSTSKGSPKTKASRALRRKHQKDDVKLLKQDLKYNTAHAKEHRSQARKDRQLIKKKLRV